MINDESDGQYEYPESWFCKICETYHDPMYPCPDNWY
jgi:hypothetical protein